MTTNQQMELSMNSNRVCASTKRPQRRMGRASWWFARMREAVDSAVDWRPAPPARPEQMWFRQ